MTENHPSGLNHAVGNLVDLVRERVQRHPEKVAFRFLQDGEVAATVWTYADLDRRARAIAARLQDRVGAGQPALLAYPAGMELECLAALLGCLYAGVVAVPAQPPRPHRSTARLSAIVASARPAILLTATRMLCAPSPSLLDRMPELQVLPRLATDEAAIGSAQGWRAVDIDQHTLAFLQYTSGSTAAPKGVMVTHGNLLTNLGLIQRAWRSGLSTRGVFWLPLYHDMGLIGAAFGSIYCGGTSDMMSPAAFLQRPARWLEAISRCGATVTGGPDFAYNWCVRRIGPEIREKLDLSTLEVACTGAETVRPDTLEQFAAAFGPCGFRREAFFPCYGLAEATLMVSGGPRLRPPVVVALDRAALAANRVVFGTPGEEGTQRIAGCGQTVPGHRVVIVDPETSTPCPPDRIGEIWVSGPSVTRGYYQAPEATAATFQARLADGGGPYLRTGDLGFFLNGELFITGRLKDLIILHGRNHYPQDIEWSVQQSHPAYHAGAGAAFSVEVERQERLVVVQEVGRRCEEPDPAELLRAARLAVAADHEVDVYAVVLVKVGEVPRTTSGKVRRRACREAFLAGRLQVVARWTEEPGDDRPAPPELSAMAEAPRPLTAAALQAWLASCLAARLGVPSAEIEPERPFSSYGLSSVQALTLTGELAEQLGRPLSPTVFYNYPNLRSLARYLAGEAQPHPATAQACRTEEDRSPDMVRQVAAMSEAELEAWISQQSAKLQ